jgi:cysteinyl-tRNA synthetase
MYFCGPTVYQRIHVGNARPYVISLWLKRWLELQGYEVKLVENITDVNDKIYDAAREQGIASAELARQACSWYIEDTEELGLGRPDEEPLASETMPEIVALIEELIERGLAYESGGDVYFRVASYPRYGTLSGAKLDDMVAQEPSELKEDPRDFALWKATKPQEDTSWDSPWGAGRPGWHIECSAMAEKHLGPVFEIHGGGLDLRFPHHENELAQSRGAGREFARLWAHNGMLELAEEKMSKSLGNIVSLRDALDRWGREAVLLLFLGAHYRSPVEFSDDAMEQARAQADDFGAAFRVVETRGDAPPWDELGAALDDDFNTPSALAILHAWRRAGRTEELERGLSLFGLEAAKPVSEAPAEIRRLAEAREAARGRKEFEEADRLRLAIEDEGWEVQDIRDGFRLIPRA